MGLAPSEVRRLTEGEFLALVEAYEDAHTPADQRRPPKPTAAQIEALRRATGGKG